MKYILLPIALLFLGCSDLPKGYFEEISTSCDKNGILWTTYGNGRKEIHKDDLGRYTECKELQ